MDLFLKLPVELWVLIIKYINDKSKIEELISIPVLQNYALQARFSKYQLFALHARVFKYQPADFMQILADGSLKDLEELYELYNFKPSRIVIEANKMNELLELKEEPVDSQNESSVEIRNMNQYRHAEFELLITNSMHVDLELILKDFNVVGVHLFKDTLFKDTPLEVTLEELKAFQIYLQRIQYSKINILTTIYHNFFVAKFPTSLRKLTLNIYGDENVDVNLRDLQCLEYFECKFMSGVESLDALQLSSTIKFIKFSFCGFKTLGNLRKYNCLRTIEIFCCWNLYNIIKCFFPNSLETLILNPSYHQSDITKLHDFVKEGINKEFEISDFTSEGNSFLLGSNFKLPLNTKTLKIDGESYGESNSIELGGNLCLKTLHTLELCEIQNLDLIDLFASLPEHMIDLKIIACEILKVDKCLNHPYVQQFCFSYNTVSNIFQINLKESTNLNHFEIGWNALAAPDNKEEKLDPAWFLINEHNVFEGASGHPNKKRKVFEMTNTLQINNFDITHLDLSKSHSRIFDISVVNNSNSRIQLPSQICIKSCTRLKVLILKGLSIQVIDLNNFPCSLEALTITGLKLIQLKGEFSNLNQLRYLNFGDNGISYSMLTAQKFPSTLEELALSGYKVEHLSCLKIDNCINMKTLQLIKVDESQKLNGADELKELFIKLVGIGQSSRALVRAYETEFVIWVTYGRKNLDDFSWIHN
ncbi:uncharacterized protein KGF55_004587 [Candida pseudojiufengensis]|uniref:uncharacterized protein n=1 Tax=Candida pseudojiufengensis TaxID=497109 RepID=UPI0022251958|nr:uncharacterized protein KGF55_004587 [Candida pseudojiufengensis]KAI5960295.1 hypothetical protein KGF55_004587 [Candida pseudojiufengensis]